MIKQKYNEGMLMKELKRNDFFFCYEKELGQILIDSGCKYIAVGLNPNNLKKFLLFQQTDKARTIIANYMNAKLLQNVNGSFG